MSPQPSTTADEAELESSQEDDDDLDEGDEEELSTAEVIYEAKDWTVAVLKQFSDSGTIILQPDYQREYVWVSKPELRSRLIESLLMNIPIPPLYLGKLRGGKYEVIDGQQRLKTILRFVDKDTTFALQKLKRLRHLNGLTFQQLNSEDQLRITTSSTMRSIVIDASKDNDLRYEIFERLNRGSVQLSEQEIRNCIYRGAFNDLLNEEIKDPCWRKIVGSDRPMQRYKEQEHVLRLLALAKRLDLYKNSLKPFINKFMEDHKDQPAESPLLKEFDQTFRKTMQNVYDVFGEKSARLYGPAQGQRRLNEGAWDRDFSIAALEIQASALLGHNRLEVQAVADQIKEAYVFYLLTNQHIRTAISEKTSKNLHVKLRWTGFKAAVNDLLLSAKENPRFFGTDFRRRLFDEDPTCKICTNAIHGFDDCTVDHKVPWSKGGKTVAENGQLSHRLCNAHKNATV